MRIESLQLRDLQTLEHVLSGMIAEGVVTISDALQVVRSARDTQHHMWTALPVEHPRQCPDCGGLMVSASVDIASIEAGLAVYVCKNCRYSVMEEY